MDDKKEYQEERRSRSSCPYDPGGGQSEDPMTNVSVRVPPSCIWNFFFVLQEYVLRVHQTLELQCGSPCWFLQGSFDTRSFEAERLETPVRKAPKKPKDRRNKISHSNDGKAITGNPDFRNVTYNFTVGEHAQVAVGNKARIENNYYNCACAKQDEKTVSSTLEDGAELTTYLKVFYRTGKRPLLLPLPWMEGNHFHIENICSPTTIAETYTKHDLPLESIFFKTETDPKNIRRILIEGEPGIGKSALCRKIAYDWSINNTPGLWPIFEVVLHLKCRDIHPGLRDLWDAMTQFFSVDLEEKKDEVFTYIKENQKKVLLILDDYDKIPDKSAESMKQSIERLIHGQLLPYCHIIVTSRPGKAAEIRNHFDRKLEIKGFKLENSFTFINRFSPLNSVPQTTEAAILSIKKSKELKDLVRSPFFTSILCLVYQENKDAASLTLDNVYSEITFSIFKSANVDTEINDDDLMTVFHGSMYFLGKMAFRLIKENQDCIDEKELGLAPVGIARLESFLVNRKMCNSLRPVSYYHFPHNSIKDYLAFNYVMASFTRFNGREMYSILSFEDFDSFKRFLKLMHAHLKFKTRIASKYLTWPENLMVRNRICRTILCCLLYSIYITIKIISCFISLVMKMISGVR